MKPFVHLHVHSPYSFLDGASSIKDYINEAVRQEMPALALTDHNTLSGAVEFVKASKEAGLKGILGVEITLEDTTHMTLLAENPLGYENLCKLLTKAFQKEGRVDFETLSSHKKGLLCLSGCRRSALSKLFLKGELKKALQYAHTLKELWGTDHLFLEVIHSYLPRSTYLLQAFKDLSEKLRLPLVATNNVHYVKKEDFYLHDLLVCTRTKTTVDTISKERPLNNENYFASYAEMKNRFAAHPLALETTRIIAERCSESLLLGTNLFPNFQAPKGFSSSFAFLSHLSFEGAKKRYGTLTEKITHRIQHELTIIEKLQVADYFLTVWDVVEYAKKEGIRYAGRGSAADSAVAYCLGITNVDSIARGLLFERFLSLERSQKPDIDVDFDARYRDKVADYLYTRYGPDKVASVCTFSTYYARSALKDIGRALGYNPKELSALTKGIPQVPSDGIQETLEKLPELKQHPLKSPKYAPLLGYCASLAGFPRHIGTHLGGIVIAGEPLQRVSPLQISKKGVSILQFDKTTIEDLGLIKLDLLSLRTLSVVAETAHTLKEEGLDYNTIPLDCKETYAMLGQGDTVGVFQLESPAQRALQARLQANCFEDIVASVALIRPGPIQGNMVEPFLARRMGLEEPCYLHPKLRPILEKTYGVVLYQEQVIEIASSIAGFTKGEADRLRRVMTKFRSQEEMKAIGEDFVQKAMQQGVEKDIAQTIFSYIQGYAGYGFCEAHAAAFSDTAYKTAYLLKHYPAPFYAALLNQQPMGFYPPNTLCVQARAKGIEILPLDINASSSHWVAGETTLRVGLKQVRQMEESALEEILALRKSKPIASLSELLFRTHLKKEIAENLVLAGAFDSLYPNRRALLWKIGESLRSRQGRLFFPEDQVSPSIADFPPKERWLREFHALGIGAKTHILDFYRIRLKQKGFITSEEVKTTTAKRVRVAGLVLRPHRPPTKSGKTVVFLTLEDEAGLLDVTIFEDVYTRFAEKLFSSPLLAILGDRVVRDNALSIIASRIEVLEKLLD